MVNIRFLVVDDALVQIISSCTVGKGSRYGVSPHTEEYECHCCSAVRHRTYCLEYHLLMIRTIIMKPYSLNSKH